MNEWMIDDPLSLRGMNMDWMSKVTDMIFFMNYT